MLLARELAFDVLPVDLLDRRRKDRAFQANHWHEPDRSTASCARASRKESSFLFPINGLRAVLNSRFELPFTTISERHDLTTPSQSPEGQELPYFVPDHLDTSEIELPRIMCRCGVLDLQHDGCTEEISTQLVDVTAASPHLPPASQL